MDRDSDAILREPPVAGDEQDTLLGALERERRNVAWKCGDLTSAGLRATLGPSTMSLGSLLKHLALVEDDMSRSSCTASLPIRPGTPSTAAPTRTGSGVQRPETARSSSWRSGRRQWTDPAPWSARPSPTAAWAGSAAYTSPGGQTPSLRRLLMDMIEEYARHAGHADLIRESVDGLVGEDPE